MNAIFMDPSLRKLYIDIYILRWGGGARGRDKLMIGINNPSSCHGSLASFNLLLFQSYFTETPTIQIHLYFIWK